jgi:hypothetical protein
MNLKIDVDGQQFLAKLGRVRSIATQAMPQIYQEFVRRTPIRSGAARASTTLQGKKIRANYPYAQVLNDGRSFRDGQMRGSDQAPQGMVTPTLQFARDLLRRLAQQAGR